MSKDEVAETPTEPVLSTEDRGVLAEHLQPEKLDTDHPLSKLLARSDSYAIRELLCLADDIRVVRSVDGAKGLFASLRNDKDNFANYRFELRLAAAIARSSDQKLLRLAGKATGPDFVFQAKSGHKCGVACYRVSAEPTRLLEAQQAIERMVQKFFRRCCSAIEKDVIVQLNIPSFPLTLEQEAVGTTLLRDFWLRPENPRLEKDGFKLTRYSFPPGKPKRPAIQRRVVARVQVPVKDYERRRVQRHLDGKLLDEIKSWVTSFDGVPIFAIEE